MNESSRQAEGGQSKAPDYKAIYGDDATVHIGLLLLMESRGKA
jgi:hypothetical protein